MVSGTELKRWGEEAKERLERERTGQANKDIFLLFNPSRENAHHSAPVT